MTILELKTRFQEELSEQYTVSESLMLFYIFAEREFGFSKHQIRKFLEQEILSQDEDLFDQIISTLKSGKPYQQIIGETEFYGKKFFVNDHVLIPRPETEELLELASHYISEYIKNNNSNDIKILDIGTGSAVIPIILKIMFPSADITSIDISTEALDIARKNAELHNTEINFVNKDYLNEKLDNIYDVIISNPPYIGIEENIEIEDSVKGFEPNIALFSPTSDALIFYRKIAEDSKNHLTENGLIFLEINQKLGKKTLDLYQNFKISKLIKDISENDRMIYSQK